MRAMPRMLGQERIHRESGDQTKHVVEGNGWEYVENW